MARSRSRGSSNRAASSRGSKREAKSKKSAAPAAVAEVEVVEEGKGMGIDDGMVIMVTVLLIAAFVLVDYVLGTDYDKGFLFKS